MPRKKIPKRAGRPEKPIDWELVDKLLLAGCLGTEMAAHFDMHCETFYRRVEEKYLMGFTAYCSEKRSKGDSLIRQVQFSKALKGDNTQLVWLGKNRLGQSDSPQALEIAAQHLDSFKLYMDQISSLQSALNIAANNNNADSKS